MLPNSLRSRLALLLLLANLPAAALAIGATMKGRDTEVAQREHAIVQRAALIATRAGLTLGIAEGVADTLAANAAVASATPDCVGHLRNALAFRQEYTGIVVAGSDGETLCSYGVTEVSSTGRSALRRAIDNAEQVGDIVFLPETIEADDKVVLMSRAFVLPGGERRAIGLLLKRDVFDAVFLPTGAEAAEISVLALMRDGSVVSEFLRSEGSEDWQPQEALPATDPSGVASQAMLSTRGGQPYHYAIAPVRGTMSNVVLATPMSIINATDWLRFLSALAAPLLMLLLGIFAVFTGVDHLVLRWIARFRQVTSSYARGDYAPRIGGLERAPSELAELGSGVNDMAGRIQDRSTALEEALSGKNALLRELHHRVKNNFQMIASLLALQRRELPNRLRTLLRVPEDRVLAMAAAYKASYATGEIGRVSAIDLLRDIAAQLRQSFGVPAPRLRVDTGGAPVWLDLDQAVPLGLLVSEILSAALERDDAAKTPFDIQVVRPDADQVHVEISGAGVADVLPTTGLAARLVAAYRTQIAAKLVMPDDNLVRICIPMQVETGEHPGRVELGA